MEVVNKIEASWESTLEELRQEDESARASGGACLHYVACSPSDDGFKYSLPALML